MRKKGKTRKEKRKEEENLIGPNSPIRPIHSPLSRAPDQPHPALTRGPRGLGSYARARRVSHVLAGMWTQVVGRTLALRSRYDDGWVRPLRCVTYLPK